jgi:hypothetical protein
MRVFGPIVEAATDLVPIRAANFIHRRGMRSKPIGDDPAGSAVFFMTRLRSFSAAVLSRFAVTTASNTSPS